MPSIRCSCSTPPVPPASPRACSTPPAAICCMPILTMKWTFDLKPDDVFWCTADIGWVTGHTYITYGPLACGATEIVFEGVPTYPDAGRFWKMIQDHKVNIFYTAPTAIRSLIKAGEGHPDHASEEIRPVQPAPARLGRRADQPGSLDVVLRQCRRRPLPDRRYLLADRNRRPHDHPAARRHAAGARLLHAAVPRHHGRHRRRDRARRGMGQGRFPGGQEALAVDDPHHLGRPGALQEVATTRKTSAASCTSPATARCATPRPATSPSWAASTTC